jgi:hypothetical protein
LTFHQVGGKDGRPCTTWAPDRSSFVIALPKGPPPSSPTSTVASFNDDLLACFDSKRKASIPERPAASTTTASAPAPTEDWADVQVDRKTGKATAVDKPTASSSKTGGVDFLPSAAELPRPEDLFKKPPYHMIIRRVHEHTAGLEIQCSHSISLELLNSYLEKWVKQNHSDTRNPPCIVVALQESPFGLGISYDRLLVLGQNRNYIVSVPIVLALVEGVLGYELVKVDDGSWQYRRDRELRKL